MQCFRLCRQVSESLLVRIDTRKIFENLEFEADQRRVENLIRDVSTDEGCKGVVTPGVSVSEGGQIGEALVGGAGSFRAVAA